MIRRSRRRKISDQNSLSLSLSRFFFSFILKLLSFWKRNSHEIFDVRRILQGGVVQLRFVIIDPSDSGLILCVLRGRERGGQEVVRERREKEGAIKQK